jgi:hypothetical protein
MYTLARGNLLQRVFAGDCSVMHQWHPAHALTKQENLLQMADSLHMTAAVSSPFSWNGSLVDVDGHLRGATGDYSSYAADDWGLGAHELDEEVVPANAR